MLIDLGAQTPTKQYEDHPVATLFPMMDTESFAALKADIEANGLHECIDIFEGKILDGRNRYQACLELEIDAHYRELEECIDPIAYVIGKNLRRRYLTTSQKAMCAARLQQSNMMGVQKCTPSAEAVASMFGVSRRAVFQALDVLHHGCVQLIERCDQGRYKVSVAAQFTKLKGKSEQSEIVDQDGVRALVAKSNRQRVEERRKKKLGTRLKDSVELAPQDQIAETVFDHRPDDDDVSAKCDEPKVMTAEVASRSATNEELGAVNTNTESIEDVIAQTKADIEALRSLLVRFDEVKDLRLKGLLSEARQNLDAGMLGAKLATEAIKRWNGLAARIAGG